MKAWQFLSSTAIAATVLPLMVGSAQAAITVLTIDPFTFTPPQTISGGVANQTFFAPPVNFTSPLLGANTRAIDLNVTQVSTPGQDADVTIGNGSLSISNGTGVKSNSIFSYTGFSPADFTTGGADRFLFNIIASDFPGEIDVNVNSTTITITTPQLAVNQTVELLYAAFPSSVNFANVSAFSFTVDTPGAATTGGGDISLSFVATGQGNPLPPNTEIPEPSSVLGILTIGALGGLSKLKNKKRG